ncbi:hypothetical protein GGR57DRAFT_470494 [Xylariaceae sp. FL1272]|nr:hypothetical protein GGR57DRAFT_470494 [Xylariaceae sp. FL1272]
MNWNAETWIEHDILDRFISIFVSSVDISFFALLETEKSVVTGADFIHLLCVGWQRWGTDRRGSLVLDILCPSRKSQEVIFQAMRRMGYRSNTWRCSHALGEWAGLPTETVRCLLSGDCGEKVIHIISLERAVEEVLLSRVYGSMVGTYVTGQRRIVCLFPHLTFSRRFCWIPQRIPNTMVSQFIRKYVGWNVTRYGGKEVEASFRSGRDRYCWMLLFSKEGRVVGGQVPLYDE